MRNKLQKLPNPLIHLITYMIMIIELTISGVVVDENLQKMLYNHFYSLVLEETELQNSHISKSLL